MESINYCNLGLAPNMFWFKIESRHNQPKPSAVPKDAWSIAFNSLCNCTFEFVVLMGVWSNAPHSNTPNHSPFLFILSFTHGPTVKLVISCLYQSFKISYQRISRIPSCLEIKGTLTHLRFCNRTYISGLDKHCVKFLYNFSFPVGK